MRKFKNIEEALQKFEEAAIKHAGATEQGDYKTANKCYAVIANVILFLKEQNEIKQLSVLLNNDSVGVRGWAATYLLPIKEREAIQVLGQIAGGIGIHSFTAKTTLSEWGKGKLKL